MNQIILKTTVDYKNNSYIRTYVPIIAYLNRYPSMFQDLFLRDFLLNYCPQNLICTYFKQTPFYTTYLKEMYLT